MQYKKLLRYTPYYSFIHIILNYLHINNAMCPVTIIFIIILLQPIMITMNIHMYNLLQKPQHFSLKFLRHTHSHMYVPYIRMHRCTISFVLKYRKYNIIFTLAGAPSAYALVVVVVGDVASRKVAVVNIDNNKMVIPCIYKSFEYIFIPYSFYFGTTHFVVDVNH